jgi:hypothetical protein
MLFEVIEATIDRGLVPFWLVEQLHELLKIGNFAAHRTKDTNSGAILDVEPGEADCTLDILDGLFDHSMPSSDVSVELKRAALGRREREVVVYGPYGR